MSALDQVIVVVDDNADVRDLITRILEDENFTAFSASGATSGLALICEKSPELLLLDVMMPEKSGIDLLRELRASSNPIIRNLPVLMITAKSQIEDIELALSAGATSYIVKPFRADVLIEKVTSLISTRRS